MKPEIPISKKQSNLINEAFEKYLQAYFKSSPFVTKEDLKPLIISQDKKDRLNYLKKQLENLNLK